MKVVKQGIDNSVHPYANRLSLMGEEKKTARKLREAEEILKG